MSQPTELNLNHHMYVSIPFRFATEIVVNTFSETATTLASVKRLARLRLHGVKALADYLQQPTEPIA